MSMRTLVGECLVEGEAAGQLMRSDLALSFMGGVDPATGRVTDVHHPLHGQCVAGKVLAIPSGRGSCSGSLVMFELLMNGHAPRALILEHKETILTLGVVIALELFARGIPVVRLPSEAFAALTGASYARVEGATIEITDTLASAEAVAHLAEIELGSFLLTPHDRRFLAGELGEAARLAMRIVIRAARLEGADSLVDVDMAHIDGCFYQGPASLQFARKLRDLGGKVRVPSTMNAICVDRRRWRDQGVAEGLGRASDELAECYVAMGVKPTYTCAPYLIDPAPAFGQQIAWAESNAVMFANSVLGARTMKYPDYLDMLVAITGRAPNADSHRPERRLATLRVDVDPPRDPDDAFWPLLGYHLGKVATNEIPVVCGLEGMVATHDDLKAFGAAFATTSAAPMFHILGITPEAATLRDAAGPAGPARHVAVTRDDLRATWRELSTASDPAVDLVALGNPHFSLSECSALARLCAGRKKVAHVALIVTCGRDVYAQAEAAGYVDSIRAFGGQFLNDTCWCFIAEPVVAREARCIATNSGKYAHYGPAAVGKGFHFASLASCVEAACTGAIDTALPGWLAA